MTSPLTQAGAQNLKPTRYATIYTDAIFTGLWTQRSQLRDAATSYLIRKFYSGSRYESLIDGSNVEVTNSLTLARRPGLSVYNSATFPAIDSFYEFRSFVNNAEVIHVMADTAGVVYDATGPSTQTAVFNKTTSGQAYLQGVGNELFMGDGADLQKWIAPTNTWAANSSFQGGNTVTDTNGNLEKVIGLEVVAGAHISVTVANNVLSLSAGSMLRGWTVGMTLTFQGLDTATFLNGQSVVLTQAAFNDQTFTGTCTASFGTSNFGPTAQTTGTVFVTSNIIGIAGTSGNSNPSWATSTGATTVDNQLLWTNQGPAVSNWGIAAPTTAPIVVNVAQASPFATWAASTYYSPSYCVVDNLAGPGPFVQQITATTGDVKVGAAQPAWNATVGGTTTDNHVTWTNQGLAARAITTAYAVNRIISVNWTITRTITIHTGSGGGRLISGDGGGDNTIVITNTYTDFFQCTKAGTTSSTATASVPWSSGFGTTVTDGTVIWTNIGTSQVWGNIGANNPVGSNNGLPATQILDSNNNLQNVIRVSSATPALSGAAHPTWATTVGSITTDNSNITWSEAGPSPLMSNTGAWTYWFAYKNSLTGHVSTVSPVSVPIILAANSYINVSGPNSSDKQVDTVEIYRTAQGGSLPLFLADVPIVFAANSTWNYSDFTLDANLNTLIEGAQDHANDPPPTGLIALSFHLERIFGSVGNSTFYSAGPDATIGSGNEAFPPANVFVWPSQVVRHQPTALGLLVHTVSDIYLIAGQGTSSSPLFPIPFLQGIGLANFNAYTVNGSILQFLTADGQLIALDPSSGVSEVGFPIGDKLQNFPKTTSYVTWHVAGSTDKALYIADGVSTWYRLNPTSAPENGLTWSPLATVAAGFQAVQSVETTPGVKTLLFGPASSGPILKRDTTVSQDNGVNYSAFATIGSIVLAQPGQIAELNFITTECTQVGSRPAVSVIIDEISGQGGTPSFTTLPLRVNDPPDFVTSTSLFTDRWYFSAAAISAWCRHLQIKIAWPSENARNELLAFSLNGALASDH